MDHIVFVNGAVADAIGAVGLRTLAENLSKESGLPVSVLVHGSSEHHNERRYRADVKKESRHV